MKSIYLFILIATLPFLAQAQQISLVTSLHDSIEESSGLIYLNGKFITHNDSGGDAALYEIDTLTGDVTRTVFISNANNTDWEDICMDSTYIYIADFGNNSGSRTNLKVYRLAISAYENTLTDSVLVDTINFSYADQTDFSSSSFSTNFDAEAIISYQDSLYIFTKNWGDNWTNIYPLAKTPGTYSLEKTDSIDVQGLITGADYNEVDNNIMLSGYGFVIEIVDFTATIFSSGTINRYTTTTPAGTSVQVEGITSAPNNQYYLTSETSITGTPSLFKLSFPIVNIQEINPVSAQIFPNPSNDFIQIVSEDFYKVEIYDLQGNLHKTNHQANFSTKELAKGVYILLGKDDKGKQIFTEKIIVD